MTTIPLTEEAAAVLQGLRSRPPRVAPRYFYDARGSELFDRITRTKEYYPTRCELEILNTHGAEIGRCLPAGAAVVELGSGSGEKASLLLRHLHNPRVYRPVDISAPALERTRSQIRSAFPELAIDPRVADFKQASVFSGLPEDAPRIVFYPGSTIGNLTPAEASAFLRHLGGHLGRTGWIVLGLDRVKPPEVLEAAYNDADGITASFNRNLLAHLNARFGSDFVPHRFAHRAMWNPRASRIEMHLVSNTHQEVHLGDHALVFEPGDAIHTESSYKYSTASICELAENAGLTVDSTWTDARAWFAVALLRPPQ